MNLFVLVPKVLYRELDIHEKQLLIQLDLSQFKIIFVIPMTVWKFDFTDKIWYLQAFPIVRGFVAVTDLYWIS